MGLAIVVLFVIAAVLMRPGSRAYVELQRPREGEFIGPRIDRHHYAMLATRAAHLALSQQQHDSLGIFVLHLDEDTPTVAPPGKVGTAVQRLESRETADTQPDYLRWSLPVTTLPPPPKLPRFDCMLPPPMPLSNAA